MSYLDEKQRLEEIHHEAVQRLVRFTRHARREQWKQRLERLPRLRAQYRKSRKVLQSMNAHTQDAEEIMFEMASVEAELMDIQELGRAYEFLYADDDEIQRMFKEGAVQFTMEGETVTHTIIETPESEVPSEWPHMDAAYERYIGGAERTMDRIIKEQQECEAKQKQTKGRDDK